KETGITVDARPHYIFDATTHELDAHFIFVNTLKEVEELTGKAEDNQDGDERHDPNDDGTAWNPEARADLHWLIPFSNHRNEGIFAIVPGTNAGENATLA